MITPFVVIAQILIQTFSGVDGAVIIVEIHILIFDGAPQTFYKDVVISPAPVIHAELGAGV